MNLPRFRGSSGFTLIELMVVMTVIAILATMALYGLGKAQASARDTSRQQIMTGVQTALERYYGDEQVYPPGDFCQIVATLVAGKYLDSGPEDPTKLPVCPGGVVGGATYVYSSPDGQSYTLTLTKESGGSSDFNSPN